MKVTDAQAPSAQEAADGWSASWAPLALLVILYAIAVAIYMVLAHQSPIPLLVPDEITYGSLAQSIAHGDGLTIRGVDVHLRSSLYIYVIAPAWKLTSGGDAFEVAQTIGAALLCLTAFPVWALARRYVGAWLALAPAALVLSGTWMLTAAGLFTENLALPLSAATLAATVVAVSRPGSRWAWVALGGALVATLARSQMAVLVPVITLAVAGDCARHWPGWRERLRAHRLLAGASAGLTIAGIIAVSAAPSSVLGIYDGVEHAPESSVYFTAVKDQLIALVSVSAVLPLVIAAAASASAEAWRDERLGPLLAVTWSAVLLFLVESAWVVGWSVKNEGVTWHIQRYIEYPLPLLLVTMTVVIVWRRAAVREIAIAGGVATLFLLAAPSLGLAQEERAFFGIYKRVNELIGTSPATSLALASAVLVLVALGATAFVRRPAAVLGVVSAAILVTFVVQAQVAWDWQKTTSRGLGDAPRNRSWIDDAGGGPVARMLAVSNTPRAVMTQLFNHDVDRAYVPQDSVSGAPVDGRQCPWTVNAAGFVDWGAGCGPAPTRLLLDDDFARIQFHDQKVVATEPRIGRLIELRDTAPSRARLKAILRVPCGPAFASPEIGGLGRLNPPKAQCFPAMTGGFWLDDPGTLVLRFRGGSRPLRIAFAGGARVDVIKPDVTTTLRLPIPQGASSFEAQLEWDQAGPGFPRLAGAEIVERDRSRTQLLY